MNIFSKNRVFISLALLSLSFPTKAAQITSDSGKFYFGVDAGYSKPLKKQFKDTETGAIGKLKGSKVIEGKIGYRIQDSVAFELGYSYRPDFHLALDVPDQALYKNIYSNTKVKSEVITANVLYFAQSDTKYTPYFLLGVGYAKVTPKKSTIYADIPAMGVSAKEVGDLQKYTSKRLAMRVGGGVNIAMSDHLALTLGAKIEIVRGIALKTRFINVMTGQEVKRSTIKKTIGVAEVTAGFKYSL